MKSFTVMTWTPDSTESWRDMSVIVGHDYEANPFYDRDSIHAWRDMMDKKPPDFRASHGSKFIRSSYSRLAGSELQEPAPYDFSPGDLFLPESLTLRGI